MPQHFASPFRGGHTLYTVDDVPFDHFPQYADGGPAMVVVDGWNVSVSTGAHIDGAVSGAFKVLIETPYTTLRHPLDEKPFPTQEAAKQAQYEAGLIAFMVYDDSKWANAPMHDRAQR